MQLVSYKLYNSYHSDCMFSFHGPSTSSDTKFQAMRRTPSPDNTRGITIAAAKFSSEDAATLVQYTIAIIEFTRLCTPLKSALDRQHQLEREIEENERIAKEKANKVCI